MDVNTENIWALIWAARELNDPKATHRAAHAVSDLLKSGDTKGVLASHQTDDVYYAAVLIPTYYGSSNSKPMIFVDNTMFPELWDLDEYLSDTSNPPTLPAKLLANLNDQLAKAHPEAVAQLKSYVTR